ncbi:MAG: ABC transporter permease [Bryobacteraceae bacterium]
MFFLHWFRRGRLERELADEMEAHLEERTAELMGAGLSASDAHARARREFGNTTLLCERSRDVWSLASLDNFFRTLTHAARALRRGGAYTAVSIITLALGIGANTAIFSLIDAVLLRPLPYKAPEQLMRAGLKLPGMDRLSALTPEFVAFRNENHTFTGLVAWNDEEHSLTGAGEPERVSGAVVSGDFLSVLGVRPSLGRSFRTEEDRPGGPRVAIISDELWRRHWNASPSVIGRGMALDDVPVEIVGVLPRNFIFPGDLRPDVLMPGQFGDKPNWSAPTMGVLGVVGRLRPGVSRETAAADLDLISRRHKSDKPAFLASAEKDSRVIILPLHTDLVGNVRPALLALFASVVLILLIACANVASLQLSRFNGRLRELAMRAALGAGKFHLMRLVVTECLLLSLAGAAIGLAGAWGLIRLARPFYILLHLSSPQDITLNGSVAAFSMGLTLVCALLFAIAPAAFAIGADVQNALRSDGTRSVSGFRNAFRSLLMIGEVAMAVVLLLGAGLLLRSFQRLVSVEPGFQTRGILTMSMTLPHSRYPDEKRQSAFVQDLMTRVRALPGVRVAGAASSLPFTHYNLGADIFFEGRPIPPISQRPSVPIISATPEYFQSLGIPLLAGRDFSSDDSASRPRIAIVNTAFAQKFFPHEDPIGRHIRWGLETNWATIVGVVANSHHEALTEPPAPEVFASFAQLPSVRVRIAMRTAVPPESLVSAVRAQVLAIDRDEPLFDIATMEERVNNSLRDRRVETFLLGTFALLALCLAAAGVYGVMSYSVSQSTREIGVRMAVGATQARVAALVLKRALWLSLAGVAGGLAAAWYLTRFLSGFLYGIGTKDPLTFALGAAFLILISLIATYLPARRAASVDPVEALRAE